MAARLLAAAALLAAVGCGSSENQPHVAILAPAWIDADIPRFEQQTGCRVDLRVYDDGEDLPAIAKRRETDVVAAPVPRGQDAEQVERFVEVTLDRGVKITIPERLASAFHGPRRPAGSRGILWLSTHRGSGDRRCIGRWILYVTPR
ncbi:MAG TPA: hypothetical protein VNB86_01840 [Gaiellaceae bacterium]|jgi:hypothetical protein|nr:hypothetical protein [Gaiellaceae bacterium]